MKTRIWCALIIVTTLVGCPILSVADTNGVLSGYVLSLANDQKEAGLKVSIVSSPSYLDEAMPGDNFGPQWWYFGDGGPITAQAGATSDRSGHFEFLSLEPGIYHIRISGGGQWGCAAARVESGSTTYVNVHTKTEPTTIAHIVACPIEPHLFTPTETLSWYLTGRSSRL
jgi:hypothetical protein